MRLLRPYRGPEEKGGIEVDPGGREPLPAYPALAVALGVGNDCRPLVAPGATQLKCLAVGRFERIVKENIPAYRPGGEKRGYLHGVEGV